MLHIVKQGYYFFHKLQLDVVVGAVCLALWFAHLCKVQIPAFGIPALALSVWIIYTLDHLWDARQYPYSRRYIFYKQYAKPLQIMLVFAVSLLAIFVFYLPFALVIKGVLIALPIVAYQVLLIWRPVIGTYLKEVSIAFCYTFGVSIFLLEDMHRLPAFLILWLFLLAWLSLVIYSYIEKKEELAFGMKNIVYLLGNRSINKLLKGIGLLLCMLSIYIGFELLSSIPFIFTALLMVILTSILPLFDSGKHRYLGEAVFFIPGIYLLIFS